MSDDADFRINCSLFDHTKWLRLDTAAGERGCLSLVYLWGWARRNRATDGSLAGLSDAEIERAARWRGKRGVLVGHLASCGWLDGEAGAYRLHDWHQWQGYASSSAARSKAGKIAAIIKQCRRFGVHPNDYLEDAGGPDAKDENLRRRLLEAWERDQKRTRTQQRSDNDRSAVAQRIASNARPPSPSPYPTPSPTPSPTGGGEGEGGSAPAGSSAARPAGASPPGGSGEHAICARCGQPATVGPGVRGSTLPMGLDEALCAGHLTVWFQARDAAERAARAGRISLPFQQPSGHPRAISRPPEPVDSS